MLKILFLLFCLFVLIKCKSLVETKQGLLQGKEVKNDNDKLYYSFTGVPYAEPPVKNFRFKPPQKLKPWTGILNATHEGQICRQINKFMKVLQGDEDCLYLNVYVPSTSTNTLLPVLFWIHGGGFIFGSGNSDMHGPDYLMDYDIILVTINHRLGAMGFLNLELEGAPGNMGLLDQVEALRWVNENIEAFGGNPNNITIAGVSAGAASVQYLILSDITKNLFQQAIMQSGSTLNPWALQKDPPKRGFDLCEVLGHPVANAEQALNFLRHAPIDDVLSAKVPPEVDGQLLFDFVFVPSIEKKFYTHEPLITEKPINKLKSGMFNKVPTMMGFNSAEGMILFAFVEDKEDLLQKFENDFERFVPNDLEIPLRSERSINLARDIREFYFQNKSIFENIQGFVDAISDNWFTRGIVDQAKMVVESQNEPVYFYEYLFHEYSPGKMMADGVKGAAHLDEIPYIFKSKVTNINEQSPSVVTNRKRLLELWTNFIKSGNPTPDDSNLVPVKWEPVTKDHFNFLRIDADIIMDKNPEYERIEFWEKAKKTYNS